MASRSYWCYSCSRFVWVSDSISCPDCDGGFLEHIQEPVDFTPSDSFHRVTSQHRSPTRFPPSSSSMHASTAENSPTPTADASNLHTLPIFTADASSLNRTLQLRFQMPHFGNRASVSRGNGSIIGASVQLRSLLSGLGPP